MTTSTSALENENIAVKRRRSGRLKRQRNRHGHSIIPERLACPICLEEFDDESTNGERYIGCSNCGRCFHNECSGIQKGGIGWKALSCDHHGLQCVRRNEVKKVNTVSSRRNSKSVPHTIGVNRTLLELQWLKRKRVKRIDVFESNEVRKSDVDVASHREKVTSVGLEKECPVSYVQKELDLERGVDDNSIGLVVFGFSHIRR